MNASKNIFKFKKFEVLQDQSAMKIGTDGVLLGAWVALNDAKTLLDIGTGTGLIALMCAQRHNNIKITAVEIEENAAKEATYNFDNSPWSNRLKVINTDFKEYKPNHKFDVIVSNPPYFDENVMSEKLQRNIARHTELLSLKSLINRAKEMLSPEGKISLVLPFNKLTELKPFLEKQQLFLSKICYVKGRKDVLVKRILVEIGFVNQPIVTNELVIEIDRHVYTEEYQALTRDFYLKM